METIERGVKQEEYGYARISTVKRQFCSSVLWGYLPKCDKHYKLPTFPHPFSYCSRVHEDIPFFSPLHLLRDETFLSMGFSPLEVYIKIPQTRRIR
jgi:hypothetical protein